MLKYCVDGWHEVVIVLDTEHLDIFQRRGEPRESLCDALHSQDAMYGVDLSEVNTAERKNLTIG